MGIGSYQGLSLSVFCLLYLPFEQLGWSIGRDVDMEADTAVGIGCRRLGRPIPCGKWFVVGMNGWGLGREAYWVGTGDGPRGCTVSVLMWFSNKFVNLINCSLISRMSCPNSSWMFFMVLIWASYRSPIFLNLLEINSALSISLDVLSCVWCMHAWHERYEMICCAQKDLTNHDLIHAQ